MEGETIWRVTRLWRIARYVIGPVVLAMAALGWPSTSVSAPVGIVAVLWILGLATLSMRSARGRPWSGGVDATTNPIGAPYGLLPTHHHHGGGDFTGGGHVGGHGGHGGF